MRVAVVTGAARGIGRATAEALADAGWQVAAADLNSVAPYDNLVAFTTDVTRAAGVVRLVEEVEQALGEIDLFVNNAGVMTVGPFLEQDEAVIRRQFEVNVFGVINGMRAVLPRMLARGRGHVINVGSGAARVGVPGLSTYAATKHAVLGLSESVRAELRGTGIEISVVIPNTAATELAAGTHPAKGTRWLQPEEIARVVARLADRPRFLTHIPRRIAVPIAVAAVLPQPLRDRLATLMGTDRVAFRRDLAQRTAYEASLASQARDSQ